MNTSLEVFPTGDPPASNERFYRLVTPEQFVSVMKYVYALHCVITLCGIVGSALCIYTFLKMGLKDSVTVNFFFLAVSDLCFLLISSLYTALDINHLVMIGLYFSVSERRFAYHNTLFGFDTRSLVYIILPGYETFAFTSVHLVTFLAIQRSLCVIRPLQFKSMFTRRKTLTIIPLIWLYNAIFSIADRSYVSLSKLDSWFGVNRTVLRITRLVPNGILHFWYMMNMTLLYFACVFVVFACFIIMARALKKSVQFRKASSKMSGFGEQDSKGESEKNSGINSTKERQVIVQVAILSGSFLIGRIPVIVSALTKLIRPDFRLDNYDYFVHLYMMAYATFNLMDHSINFLVYWKFNSKFREILWHRKK